MSDNILDLLQNLSGIDDANIILAILLSLGALIASYFLFKLSNYLGKIISPSQTKTSNREILEAIFRDNGGALWTEEYSKNWNSAESWDTWKLELSRNPLMTNPKGKWAGVDIEIVFGNERVVDIQMRDNVNLTGILFYKYTYFFLLLFFFTFYLFMHNIR